MRNFIRLIVCVAAIGIHSQYAFAQRPYQGSLSTLLSAPADGALRSSKTSYDLEVCIADVVAVLGSPVALRQGANNVVIASGYPAGLFGAAVTLTPVPGGTSIEARFIAKNSTKAKLLDRMRTCL